MPFPPDSELGRLMSRFPRDGRVRWIGLRPAREVPMLEVDRAEAQFGAGLRGDRFRARSGKRGVSLMQAEHLDVIARLAGHASLDPGLLRRNLVIEGLPLRALIGRRFRVGAALLEGTGTCDPCSRMEAALGPGGYNAMLGHGGITARVLQSGSIARGDTVRDEPDATIIPEPPSDSSVV